MLAFSRKRPCKAPPRTAPAKLHLSRNAPVFSARGRRMTPRSASQQSVANQGSIGLRSRFYQELPGRFQGRRAAMEQPLREDMMTKQNQQLLVAAALVAATSVWSAAQ